MVPWGIEPRPRYDVTWQGIEDAVANNTPLYYKKEKGAQPYKSLTEPNLQC